MQLQLLGLPFQEEGEEVEAEEQEAPNPIVPEWNEVIWGSLSFLILFVVMAKYAYPAIKKAMEARTAKIQADIDGAERARSDAERVKAELDAQLADARAEANRIIDEARQQAEALKAERGQALEAELAERRHSAMADIEGAKAQAMADLQNQIAEIAIGAAERVVQANLDPATNAQIVERYIAEVGATS